MSKWFCWTSQKEVPKMKKLLKLKIKSCQGDLISIPEGSLKREVRKKCSSSSFMVIIAQLSPRIERASQFMTSLRILYSTKVQQTSVNHLTLTFQCQLLKLKEVITLKVFQDLCSISFNRLHQLDPLFTLILRVTL
jgi:hypothetical protein